jgi:hypothetical protein
MFAIIQNNQLIKTIQPHVEFELFGKTYNAKWTVRMSAAEKTSLGITDVVVQPRPDDRFYWVQENPVALVNGVPTITYTATAKLLNDREEVDEDGNPMYVKVLGEVDGEPAMVDSEERLVTKGLKSQWAAQVKDNANKALAPTDWYVIRKAERGVAIPEAVAAERAAIIEACTAKEAAIAAATTVEALKAAVA